jgi:hypothetical protein
VPRKRGLTGRSSRRPTALRLGREALWYMVRLAAQAQYRRSRLNSNVRPRNGQALRAPAASAPIGVNRTATKRQAARRQVDSGRTDPAKERPSVRLGVPSPTGAGAVIIIKLLLAAPVAAETSAVIEPRWQCGSPLHGSPRFTPSPGRSRLLRRRLPAALGRRQDQQAHLSGPPCSEA